MGIVLFGIVGNLDGDGARFCGGDLGGELVAVGVQGLDVAVEGDLSHPFVAADPFGNGHFKAIAFQHLEFGLQAAVPVAAAEPLGRGHVGRRPEVDHLGLLAERNMLLQAEVGDRDHGAGREAAEVEDQQDALRAVEEHLVRLLEGDGAARGDGHVAVVEEGVVGGIVSSRHLDGGRTGLRRRKVAAEVEALAGARRDVRVDLELAHPFAAADALGDGDDDVVLDGDARLQAAVPVVAAEPALVVHAHAHQVGGGVRTEPGGFGLRFRLDRHGLRLHQLVLRDEHEVPGVAGLGLAAAPDIEQVLVEGDDVVFADTGVEAQEGIAAEGEHAVRLVEAEGQVVGRGVGHVEVADGLVGSTLDAEMVHAVLVGIDAALVLPDELGALLDEGVLVVVERTAVLAVGGALPPRGAVGLGGGVDVADAEVAFRVAGEDPGLAFGGIGAAGQGVEARRVEQAVVVGRDGDHLGDGGGTAGRVERHRHGVVTLERIDGGDFVSLDGRAVAEVPEGDTLHRRGVGELEDVGGFGRGSIREGELVLRRGIAQLMDVQVHRAAGEEQGRRRSGQQEEVEYLLHNQILLPINNLCSA